MKKIISFSLWGDNPKYCEGAIRNTELAKKLLPEWVCRFYIAGSSVPFNVIEKLKENNSEVVIENTSDWRGMFWRFKPASELDVEMMLSRDCDSRLSEREVVAIDEWLESGKSFHIVRDHPQHGIPILGGLWGVRGDLLRNMSQLISEWKQEDRWQTDQEFLTSKIYPLVKNDVFVHDEFHNFENEKHAIKSPRLGNSFLGEIINEHEQPNQAHRNQIKI